MYQICTFDGNEMYADVRGEISRKEFSALPRSRKQVTFGRPDEQFMASVQIQSGKLLF